jgi:hypothetical protein
MFPNDNILGPIFWIVMGLIYALVIVSAKTWAKDIGLKMNWWKWTLASLWYSFLSIGVAAGFTLLGEFETKAGYYFIAITLTVMTILGVGLWRLISTGRERAENKDPETAGESNS